MKFTTEFTTHLLTLATSDYRLLGKLRHFGRKPSALLRSHPGAGPAPGTPAKRSKICHFWRFRAFFCFGREDLLMGQGGTMGSGYEQDRQRDSEFL